MAFAALEKIQVFCLLVLFLGDFSINSKKEYKSKNKCCFLLIAKGSAFDKCLMTYEKEYC